MTRPDPNNMACVFSIFVSHRLGIRVNYLQPVLRGLEWEICKTLHALDEMFLF